jgi:hypothetical protein
MILTKKIELMNLQEISLILPFTKKYGPLGEITFLMKRTSSFTMPPNTTQLEEYRNYEAHWIDKGSNKGIVSGTFNGRHLLVMQIIYNTPSPHLLIELGFNELFHN